MKSLNATLNEASNPESFLTDALVARHQAETADLPLNPPREVMLAHAQRQAIELVQHAYEMERRLHEMWQKYRWSVGGLA